MAKTAEDYAKSYCPNCMEKVTVIDENSVCPYCKKALITENEPHQLKIGTMLEKRYMVGKVLGQGGFGITYIGLDTRLGMKIAIKEFYPSIWATRKADYKSEMTVLSGSNNKSLYEKGLERFLDEAKCLAQFESMAGVVSVHNFFEENETAYIIMEYVDGLSLSQVLKSSGAMSYEKAISLMTPAMKALSEIHKKGMIHRDLSPANMILGKSGNVKILDFGAAREFSEDSDKSLSVYLKPGYTPVEQYQTNGRQGPWTDVYALAASIYKLVTGKTPESSMDRIFNDELLKPSQLNTTITSQEDAAILKGMSIRIEDRPSTMDELLELLVSAMETKATGEAVVAMANKPAERMAVAAPSTQPVNAESEACAIDQDEETVATVDDFEEDDDEATVISSIPSATESQDSEKQSEEAIDAKTERQPEEAIDAKPERQPEEAIDTKPERQPEKAAEVKPKKKFEKPVSSKPKKKRIWMIPVCILGALLLGFLVLVLTAIGKSVSQGSSNYKPTKTFYEPYYLSYTDYEITVKEAKSIARNNNLTNVHFCRCNISDDALTELAKTKTITSISISDCTGFNGLDELAGVSTLTEIELVRQDSDITNYHEVSFDNDFTCDFPYVEKITLNYGKMSNSANIFGHFPNVTILRCTGVDGLGDLSFAGDMTKLKTVYLSSCTGVSADKTDDAFAECENLQAISITKCGITDISAFSKLENIERIYVSDNNLTNLNGLENSQRLDTVEANNNSITDISALKGKTALYSLDLDNNQIEDISALSDSVGLSSISVNGNNISDISPLGNATRLYSVSFSNNKVSDISALSSCENLMSFAANNNSIENLDGLAHTRKLSMVSCNNNKITNIDGLKSSTEISALDLSYNEIEDISPIGNNEGKLRSVIISHNKITSIAALSDSPELLNLDIAFNEITDLSPLSASVKLKALYASHNKLTNLSGIENMPELAALDAASNEVTDISAYNVTLDKNVGVALEHNKITDISALGKKDIKYTVLSLYDNPISSYEPLAQFKADTNRTGSFGKGLFVDGSNLSDEDITTLAGALFQANINFVDCPFEKQNSVEDTYMEAAKALGAKLPYPKFVTTEEADAKIDEYRINEQTEDDTEGAEEAVDTAAEELENAATE